MSESLFAIAVHPTPVFDTPDLNRCFGGEDGDTLPLDKDGLFRPVETVLLPGTKLQLVERVAKSTIWRIRTDEYTYSEKLYVDARFVEQCPEDAPARDIALPSIEDILSQLEALKGTTYIWGGNWPSGIDLLPQCYPSRTPFARLAPREKKTWRLEGVDCSGLLYFCTNGYTPRNSRPLLTFGHAVELEGKSLEEVLPTLQPLDLIVWTGHVICVLDSERAIESRPETGVVICSLEERLREVQLKRKPVNSWSAGAEPCFVVRRWHPAQRKSAMRLATRALQPV